MAIKRELYDRAEKMLQRLNPDQKKDIELLKDGGLHYLCDYKKYLPNNTFKKVTKDDATVKIVIGPYGSGKTSGFVNLLIKDAVEMPYCKDEIRRSRIAIVRNTASDLESTSLETWLFWVGSLGIVERRKKPLLTYEYQFNDGSGEIHLTVHFLALDREDDIRKLSSLELTSCFINELQFVPRAIFQHIQARIGRYPSKTMFKNCSNSLPYKKHLYADTNPPDEDHWIVALENNITDKIKIYHQPPGVLKLNDNEWINNPLAENLENQDGNYYLDMVASASEEFVRVYAQGYYGTVVDGKRVYSNYNDDFHSTLTIEINQNEPFLLAFDYGLASPAALLMQYVDDQVRVIKEFCCEFMDVRELYKTTVSSFLANYPEMTIKCVGDPANTFHGRELLAEENITVQSAYSNDPGERIGAVSYFLGQLSQSKSRLLISREGCPNLRKGFLGKYHFKRLRVIGDERYRDIPEKNHPYSDIHDCLQYGCLQYKGIESNMQNQIDTSPLLRYGTI